MPKRQHQIRISASSTDGVSIHGLSDYEANLIEVALRGDLEEFDRKEALELCIEIRKAWNRKWGLKGPKGKGTNSSAEDGVRAAQRDFGKILGKADPS